MSPAHGPSHRLPMQRPKPPCPQHRVWKRPLFLPSYRVLVRSCYREPTQPGSLRMSLVSFGQPDDGIIQMAYVVEDIHAAMDHWVRKLKVGPWFLLPHFSGEEPQYRGKPSRAEVSLAMSFAGHMNVELIQPNNDAPSVYREVLEKRGPGFHHFGIATANFDADLERHRTAGHELAFYLRVPS